MPRPASPFAPRFQSLALAFGIVGLAFFGVSACKSAKKEKAPPKAEAEKKEEQKPEVPLAEQNPNKSWKISDHGVRFEPPIPKTQLPDKVWYCDMGTVHYARLQKGDQICPLCKMKLKQFDMQAVAAPGDKAEGHAGH